MQKVRVRSENESRVFKTPQETKEIVEQKLMQANQKKPPVEKLETTNSGVKIESNSKMKESGGVISSSESSES